MKIHIKNMQDLRCKLMVIAILKTLNIEFIKIKAGIIYLSQDLSKEQYLLLNDQLLLIGMEIITGKDLIITEDIKHEIYDMLNEEKGISKVNFSDRITDKLGYSNNRLSTIFKKNTKINIQTCINIEKLKLIKEMLLTRNFSKTEIADKFHFCDTKCLCHFFKKHALYTMSFFLNMKR
ncbi:MAG: hypothetical protein WCL51_06450 [Bacteroidota bacterium]